jgi:hypothetical protein
MIVPTYVAIEECHVDVIPKILLLIPWGWVVSLRIPLEFLSMVFARTRIYIFLFMLNNPLPIIGEQST